jgi:hypothetical protein
MTEHEGLKERQEFARRRWMITVAVCAAWFTALLGATIGLVWVLVNH